MLYVRTLQGNWQQDRIGTQLKSKREKGKAVLYREPCLFPNLSPAPNSSALLPRFVLTCFLPVEADATKT